MQLKYAFFLWIGISISFVQAQNEVVKLNRAQAEVLFLENNLELLAEKINVDIAEAEIIQAGVWPNPTLSIGDVNLWTPGKNSMEPFPHLIGNWGKYTQFSVELEQLVQTARKRRKLIDLQKVNKEVSLSYFEELLRELKYELRNNLIELQSLQRNESIYNELIEQLNQLLGSYQKLYQSKDISQSDLVRLQSLEIQFKSEKKEILKLKNELLKNLKILMALPVDVDLVLTEDGEESQIETFKNLDIDQLLEIAYGNRPDFKIFEQQTDYFSKKLDYEKSLRTPDLAFSVNYDRGGGVFPDFVGFGVSIDLPFFDRNKSNIKIAEIEIQQNQIQQQQKKLKIQNELMTEIKNLNYALYEWSAIDPNFESNLEKLLPAFRQNFTTRNISLLEYIDFLESYIDSKKSLSELEKDINLHWEEIQYIIGKEL